MVKPLSNSEMKKADRRRLLGQILFGSGITLLVLRGLDMTTHMSGLPVFWYSNQELWIAIGIGLSALGWKILWGTPSAVADSWQPTIAGRRFQSAILYVSDGCHLCHDALAMLKAYQSWLPPVQEVDIGSDPELVERFGTCVPVVVFEGKIRFRGAIQEDLLRRLIEGTPPAPT